MVNAMFDGMNLVAKEGRWSTSVPAFDPQREHRCARGARRLRAIGQSVRHPGAGRLDHAALTMPVASGGGDWPACTRRSRRVTGRLIDEQLRDIRAKEAAGR